ncbi:hypothetical protein, partial [Salmonella enterica]|uniref:hypothetical protein n=2 Tax=Salmonella enterica TaxID=28901 RepID=UPI001C388883
TGCNLRGYIPRILSEIVEFVEISVVCRPDKAQAPPSGKTQARLVNHLRQREMLPLSVVMTNSVPDGAQL